MPHLRFQASTCVIEKHAAQAFVLLLQRSTTTITLKVQLVLQNLQLCPELCHNPKLSHTTLKARVCVGCGKKRARRHRRSDELNPATPAAERAGRGRDDDNNDDDDDNKCNTGGNGGGGHGWCGGYAAATVASEPSTAVDGGESPTVDHANGDEWERVVLGFGPKFSARGWSANNRMPAAA
jgi:hypothetical protein